VSSASHPTEKSIFKVEPVSDSLESSMDTITETQQSSNNNLNEKEGSLLNQLRMKLMSDVFFSGKTLDDPFILKFLRAREHDVDKTVELMKGYFTMRKEHPELFKLPSEVIQVFKDKVFTIGHKTNSSGELVVIFRPGFWDPAKYDAYLIAAGPIPFLENAVLEDGIQEHGMIEVLDFSNVSWKQFMAMPASLHKISADLSERAIPIKFKKVHIVNQGRMVNMLWALMKPFVSEEMKQRLNFHGEDFSQLHKEIDKDLLPHELGGTSDSSFSYQDSFIADLDVKIKELWAKYH